MGVGGGESRRTGGHNYRGCGGQEDRDTSIGDVGGRRIRARDYRGYRGQGHVYRGCGGGRDMGVGIWGRRIRGCDYRGCGDTRKTGTRL